MPIHPAACVKCEIEWEVLTLSFKAEVDLTCPKCKKQGERRYGVPLLKTNTTFMSGAKTGMEQLEGTTDYVRKVYAKQAAAAGVSTQGKIYQGGLARFPGDPMAWCSDIDEFKTKVKLRGAECEAFGIKAREVEPTEKPVIAEDILDERVEKLVESGRLTPKKAEDKRGEIADTMVQPWKRGKYKRPAKKAKK